ncbi:Cilium assembly protein DZIP1L [Acropora cervicornis]|uniref:Cilium assembly protein DZIP1L n=1 Tax=Acropora cervicornis TaxID=6130 RepID=A0AAD9QAF3_ACRCE|nr:Cilium assembly protein DZIP1L [Acropora cervicornis]
MNQGMNFSFGRRQEKVDWRMLASVDVDRIQQEMDVKTLQNNIMHVTFCNIEAELGMHSFGCDPNFIKMFKLAQLIIEYLLHSQQFLSANLDAENRTLREAMEVAQKSKDELEERREAYKKLKKQCQKQKQWIAEYQLLIRAGASGQHKMNGMLTSVAPFKSGNAVTVETKHGMTEQEKSNLEQELERIKERLQKTERELQEERKLTESQRNRLSAEHQGIDELRLMFEKWKEEEKAEQQQEMAEFKRNYQQDLMRMQSERDDYSQVSQMQAETQQNLQKEMQKLQQKFKSREEKTKMDHREEMGKFQEMLKQYEENLNNERIEKTRLSEDYESKIQMLTSVEREQVQHASKSQSPLLQDSLPPPVPAPRQTSFVQAEPVERERASSPEKSVASGDSITLFVSSNQTKSGQFRLWRQSAYGSNEWSNLFTFSAFVKPSGNFAFPLYVFAAGGSPYWRQYISASPSPPSVEYRLDYMFYCSQTSLPGTFQCFVLEAGSVPVIRSCVSKSKDLQGWKYKGLSFFARNSTISGDKTLTSVSASFESTLTEDKSQARFNHKLDELQACRQEIGQILDQKLAKQGLSVKTKGYLEVRQHARPPSAGSKSRPGSGSPTPGSRPAGSTSPERRPPSFHATAAAVRTSSALQQSRKSPVQRGNLGSTGSTTGEMTVSVTTVTDRSLSATSVTEKTLSESEEDVSVTEDDASQDEEGSNWDSEREDAEPSPRPTHKVAVHIPSQQNFDSDSDIEEVRELADTLERNLSFGSAVKKPAGGVSLHFQGTGDARSQPQQTSGLLIGGRDQVDCSL